MEFVVDMFYMEADSIVTITQCGGDHFMAVSFCHQVKDCNFFWVRRTLCSSLVLAAGTICKTFFATSPVIGAPPVITLRIAAATSAEAYLFRIYTACPGTDCVENIFIVIKHSEHDDRKIGLYFADPSHCFHTIDEGHINIHDHHVGM